MRVFVCVFFLKKRWLVGWVVGNGWVGQVADMNDACMPTQVG